MKKHGNHGEERDELMARIKAECDTNGQTYPPELVQWLNDKERNARG